MAVATFIRFTERTTKKVWISRLSKSNRFSDSEKTVCSRCSVRVLNFNFNHFSYKGRFLVNPMEKKILHDNVRRVNGLICKIIHFSYIKEIFDLLGKDRRKLFWMLFLFLTASLLDLAGLGLIGPMPAW